MSTVLCLVLLLGAQDEPLRLSWAPPGTIDPAFAGPGPESRLVLALFEGLTTLAPDGGTVLPGMAGPAERDAEARAWTFRLREAAWSDGSPVQARHFVEAWRRCLRVGGPQVHLFSYLRGVRAWFALGEGRPDPADADLGFSAPDPRTLRVEAEGPAPWLPHLLAAAPFVAQPDGAGKRSDWTAPGTITTNGAWLHDGATIAELLLRRNPRHWDPPPPGAPARVSIALHTPAVALERYRVGRLAMLGPEQIPDGAATGLPGRQDHDLWGVVLLRLNPARAPFDRPVFRRALAQGIDRGALVRGTPAKPRTTIVPPPLSRAAGFRPDRPAALESLLLETGFDLAKAPAVHLRVPDLPRLTALAGRLRDDLEKGLGLAVRVEVLKPPAYARAVAAADFAAALDGIAGDVPAAEAFLGGAGADREQALLERAELVPLCGTWETHALAPGWEGAEANPFGHVSLRHLRRR